MTRGIGGTGLGLYICRELVRRMDGKIWGRIDARQGVDVRRRASPAAADEEAPRKTAGKPRLSHARSGQVGVRDDLARARDESDTGAMAPPATPVALRPRLARELRGEVDRDHREQDHEDGDDVHDRAAGSAATGC